MCLYMRKKLIYLFLFLSLIGSAFLNLCYGGGRWVTCGVCWGQGCLICGGSGRDWLSDEDFDRGYKNMIKEGQRLLDEDPAYQRIKRQMQQEEVKTKEGEIQAKKEKNPQKIATHQRVNEQKIEDDYEVGTDKNVVIVCKRPNVIRGETYKATFCILTKPDCEYTTYYNGQELKTNQLSLVGVNLGVNKYEGYILEKDMNGKKKRYYFEGEFTVEYPEASVTAENGVLYARKPNIITVSTNCEGSINIGCSNVRSQKRLADGRFEIVPVSSSFPCNISVSVIRDGKSIGIAVKKFTVID